MSPKTTINSVAPVVCRCIDCKHVQLHQWNDNPLIAHCQLLPRKEVARSKVRCLHFEQRNVNASLPPVVHHKR